MLNLDFIAHEFIKVVSVIKLQTYWPNTLLKIIILSCKLTRSSAKTILANEIQYKYLLRIRKSSLLLVFYNHLSSANKCGFDKNKIVLNYIV